MGKGRGGEGEDEAVRTSRRYDTMFVCEECGVTYDVLETFSEFGRTRCDEPVTVAYLNFVMTHVFDQLVHVGFFVGSEDQPVGFEHLVLL